MNLYKKLKSIITLDKVSKHIERKKTTKDNTEELVKFQESFNNSEKVSTAIITKKLSTGIDLNKSVCAIHLVDLPYTPEVEEQFLGRAVRQGNSIKNVSVYKYNTDGTLDEVKREILKEKANWQNDLLEISSEGGNELQNTAIDQDKVIAEAIARYGVNFTKEDISTIIQEQKDEQLEIAKKERELRQITLVQEFKNVIDVQRLIQDNDTRMIKEKLKPKHNLVKANKNPYELSYKKEVMPTYKLLIADAEEVSNAMVNDWVGDFPLSYNETARADINEYLNKKRDEFLTDDEMHITYNLSRAKYYHRAYHKFMSDTLTQKVKDDSSYYARWKDVEFKNPLNKAQKGQLKKVLTDSLDIAISGVDKKMLELDSINTTVLNTAKAVIEVTDDEDAKIQLQSIVDGESIFFDGVITPLNELLETFDVHYMSSGTFNYEYEATQTDCIKITYNGKTYYADYTATRYDKYSNVVSEDEATKIEKSSKKLRKKPNHEDKIEAMINYIKEKQNDTSETDVSVSSNQEVTDTEYKKTTTYNVPSDISFVRLVTNVNTSKATLKSIIGDYIKSDSKELELDSIIMEGINSTNTKNVYGFTEDGEKILLTSYVYEEGTKGEEYKKGIATFLQDTKEALNEAKILGYSSN